MTEPTTVPGLTLRPATEADVPAVLGFIRELARYEERLDQVVATEARLRRTLFGPRPYAEVVLACAADEPVGFALFFHNYSTFLARPGIYLEDLYVRPEHRGKGYGTTLLAYLGKLCLERGCGRLEWSVLTWNAPALRFYRAMGARSKDQWVTQQVAGDALVALAARFDGPRP